MTIRRVRALTLLKHKGLNEYYLEAILRRPGAPENRAQLLNLTGEYPLGNITAGDAEKLLEQAYCREHGVELTEGTEESRRNPLMDNADEVEKDYDEDDRDEDEDDEVEKLELDPEENLTCPDMRFNCLQRQTIPQRRYLQGDGYIPAAAIEDAFSDLDWHSYSEDFNAYMIRFAIRCLDKAKHHIDVELPQLKEVKVEQDMDNAGDPQYSEVQVTVGNVNDLMIALQARLSLELATKDTEFARWFRRHVPPIRNQEQI